MVMVMDDDWARLGVRQSRLAEHRRRTCDAGRLREAGVFAWCSPRGAVASDASDPRRRSRSSVVVGKTFYARLGAGRIRRLCARVTGGRGVRATTGVTCVCVCVCVRRARRTWGTERGVRGVEETTTSANGSSICDLSSRARVGGFGSRLLARWVTGRVKVM